MAIYNVSVTLPDGELDTITVEAPTRGAAQAEARSRAGLGSRIGRVEFARDSFRPVENPIEIADRKKRIDDYNRQIDSIIEGSETPKQEFIKNETESQLVARMLMRGGEQGQINREARLMAIKSAEAMAKYRAYKREVERKNPDLPPELEALGNELLPGNVEVANVVTDQADARDFSDMQQSDIASINREAERQKARQLAPFVTEDEIDEYNLGEAVSSEKARQLAQTVVDPTQPATQSPAGVLRVDPQTGIPGPGVTPYRQNFAIDEGTNVGFGAGTGIIPGAQARFGGLAERFPGGQSLPRRLPSIDEGTDVGFGAGAGIIPGATPMPRPVAPGPRVVTDASTLPRLGTVPMTTDQFAGLAEQELPFAAPRTTTPQVRVDEFVPPQEGQMTAAEQSRLFRQPAAPIGTFDDQVATGAIPGVDVTEAGAPPIAYAGAPAPSVVNVQTGIDPGLTGQAPTALGPGAAFGGTPAPATGTEVVPAAPGSFGEFVAGPEAAGIPTPGMSAAPTLQQPIQFGGLTAQDLEGISSRAAVNRAVQNLYGQQPTAVGPISDFLRRQSFSLVPAQQLGTLAQIATGQLSPQARATSFSDYLRNLEGRGGAATGFGEALQNLQTLRGLDPTSLSPSAAGAQYIFSPGTDEETGQALQFLGAAQRGRYSPFVSSIFRPGSQDEIFADYVVEADRRAREGEAARNFLDFAAGRYGL